MKFDCPHCEQSLKSHQLEAGDVFGKGKGFDCPHCGKPIKFQLHREEIGVVVLLCFGFLFFVKYFAGKSFWFVMATFVIAFVVVVAVLAYLLRNKRRYEKQRSNI